MKRLQMAGNKPIALIGGGTTMIGDPSGRTDMRKMLTKEDLSLIHILSFISLHHIFPVAQAITTPDAMGVCLVKPQFEAGREKVGKNGVVRDPATHREVLHNAMGYAAANGFVVRGLDFSPVKGPEGNIEYLMFVQKSEQPLSLIHIWLWTVWASSWALDSRLASKSLVWPRNVM